MPNSPKPHILFISSWYPNRNNPTHGIFNKAFAQAASLYAHVSVLHVCSDSQLKTDSELVSHTEKGITTVIIYYKKINSVFPIISQLKKRKQLLRGFEAGYQHLISKAGAPDLIQLNVIMPAGIGASYLSKKYGIPYLINEGWSGYCPDDGSYHGFFMKWLTRKIVARAKAILPVSEGLKQAMQNHGLKGEYTIVPNVVDINLFVPEAPVTHTGDHFLHISTLDDSQKNVSGILRAFKNALLQEPGMTLTIVGDGSNRPALESLAHQLGIAARVLFTGRLMGQALVDIINKSDALVMFSNYETFCLTVAESLACGIPVITSKAGGLTNYISEEMGMMIEKKDEGALTECLLLFKTVQNRFKPRQMRQFIADNYSAEKTGKALYTVYNSILSKK